MSSEVFLHSKNTELWTGVDASIGPAIYENWCHHQQAAISFLFISDYKTGIRWASDISFFNKIFRDDYPLEVRFLGLLDTVTDTVSYNNEDEKIIILNRLHHWNDAPKGKRSRLIIITTPDGFFQPIPSRNIFACSQISLHLGKVVPLSQLVEQLAIDLNYDSEAVCESPGQFSVRGGLVDIFPLGAEHPCRIDFFGDEMEQLRLFDPVTQLSFDSIEHLTINAVPKDKQNGKEGQLMDYLPEKIHWAFFEPEQLAQQYASSVH